ncbi:YcnI family protein [Sphingomonas bacterium]|uniref:YcnI family copper-binding membrane protein n=1 Tax=Sphingomonas bacterium TaxID=1895847 RepID=UPI0015763019|nr:YcnI family protein [Sphingomonas bacterium]
MISRIARHCAALAATLTTTMAHAHIVFADPAGMAGSYYAGFLRVSHGCAGSPTTAIRVEIPVGVTVARPQPKPGWTLSIEKAPLPAPVRSEDGEVRERVAAITWSGRLDPDQFDQFGIMLKLPAAPGPLYFPTLQQCATGRNAWTMIPAAGQPWHSVKSPAPVLEITPATPHPDAMKM